MSRILKRPMFRIGGSANDGIMSMASPRKNYEEGTANPEVMKKFLENKAALRQALGPGPSVRGDLGDLLISGGLNLLSGKGAGKGTLAALAESYKDPYQTFTKARSAEESLGRQIDLSAATGALSTIEAMEAAKRKAESDFRIASIKSGTSIDDKIESLAIKYLSDYPGDFNKAKNKAIFDLTKRSQIADKYGQSQVGGAIDIDFKDPKKINQFIQNNKNRVNQIFFDINSGQTLRLEKDPKGGLGFSVVDLKAEPVKTDSSTSTVKPEEGKLETSKNDKKSITPKPIYPSGSIEAFKQAEKERTERIESGRLKLPTAEDRKKELEAFNAKIRELNKGN